jgi:hypothetical protein
VGKNLYGDTTREQANQVRYVHTWMDGIDRWMGIRIYAELEKLGRISSES